MLSKLIPETINLPLHSLSTALKAAELLANRPLEHAHAILLGELGVGDRDSLQLAVHVDVEAVEGVAVLDESNPLASELLEAEPPLHWCPIQRQVCNLDAHAAQALLEDEVVGLDGPG